MLLACAGAQTSQLQLNRPLDLPEQALIAEVPFFPQEQYHCGPATLAMAMNYYGLDATPGELAEDVFTPRLKGSLQVEMKAAVRRRGMLAYELTPRLVYLLAEVAVGHPVIVLQNLAIRQRPLWHYAVIIGYDLEHNTVTLHTGAHANYQLSMHTFEHTWNRADNWALVVLPSDTLPNDRNQANFLQAAVTLEQAGQTASANRAWRAMEKRWPNNHIAITGMANTYLALQQPEKATAGYLRALELQPREAAIYNNLAYSLHAQSCHESSMAAIRCAMALAPGNAEYQHSLEDIASSAAAANSENCPKLACPSP